MTIAAVLTLTWAGSADGQTPATVAGDFVLVPEESADVGAAVRAGTAEASFFVRTFGRRVLERSLEPAERLSIRLAADRVGISGPAGGPPLHTPLGGAPVRVRNSAGEMESVTSELQGRSLRRVFDAGRGTRTFLYVPDADGTHLTVHVDVRSSMLSQPIRYALRYERRP